MIISHHKNGYYYIYYKDPVTQKRLSKSTGQKLKKDALSYLSEFSNQISQKSLIQSQVCIKDAMFEHLKWTEITHTRNTTLTYKTTFNAVLKYFGNINISSIDKNLLEEFFMKRIIQVSVYQARRDYIHLHCLFNRYVEKNLLNENPCAKIKRMKLPEKQPSYFNKAEFTTLINTIGENDIKDIVLFAVNTGLRQMELINLVWSQIDMDRLFLILDNKSFLTKSKKIRQVPLNNNCIEILLRRKRTEPCLNENVFTWRGNKFTQDVLSKRFKGYVLEAKINPGLNFHSLRHTFATWLVQKGVSIYKVSKLLGHSDIRVTQVYANLVIDDLYQSVSVLDEK